MLDTESTVRTFRGNGPREALDAVKAAFGADAVILSTREIGGWFGKPTIEITAAASPAPSPSPTSAATSAAAAVANRDALEQEVAQLRRTVEAMRRRLDAERDSAPAGSREPATSAIAQQTIELLDRRGVAPQVAFELAQMADSRANAHRLDAHLDEIRHVLRKRLLPSDPPWSVERRSERPRMIGLIGPTGVGKTTAVAKIAARALMQRPASVALISIDTYRIGASDQLLRYGKIMGAPAHVARDEASLSAAVKASAGASLILIDTAGRSDAQAVQTQVELLRSCGQVEVVLTLSLASGWRQLSATARRYAPHAPSRLLFTKLDESDGPGGLLSAVGELPKPICAICDGQRVPEDIHAPSALDLANIVLGA